MTSMSHRVAARFAAAGSLLKKPGLHEFDVEAGPYGATIELWVPDPKSGLSKGDRPNAEATVDASLVEDWSLFEEYEDDLLRSVKRKLGVDVSWVEGAWGREDHDGVRSRHISIHLPRGFIWGESRA